MIEKINYVIVPITEEYIEGLCAAVDSVAKERQYLAFLEGPPLEMSRAFVLKNLAENRPHFIALHKEKVVGWCGIASLDLPAFAHSGLLGIGVLADYRHQGIGVSLIHAALEKAKLIGLTRVELTVREHNKQAIALYKKMGFVIEGLHRNAMQVDKKYENIISMALLL